MKNRFITSCIIFVLLFVFNKVYAYQEISGNVSGTLHSDSTYIVIGNITVTWHAVLTIDSGAVLKFYPGTQLTCYGIINANGTASDSIIITSRDDDSYGEISPLSDGNPDPGDWRGIYLNGTAGYLGIGNFDYCRIRYGGNTAGDADANIYYFGTDPGHFNNSITEYSSNHGLRAYNSTLQMNQSELLNNAVDGYYHDNNGTLTISGNTFSDNGRYGFGMTGATNSYLSATNNEFYNNGSYGGHVTSTGLTGCSGNTGSGNGVNGFGLAGTVTAGQTWTNGSAEFPIILIGNVLVNWHQTLTIPAGTLIKAEMTGQLSVNGTLTVSGAQGDSVVFTSLNDDEYGGDTNGDSSATTAAPGDWRGIYLNGTAGYLGIGNFDYCRIRYGGNTAGDADANIYYFGTDSGHFNNSISEYSGNYGIWTNACSPSFRQNRIINNNSFGVYISNSSNPNLGNNTVSDKGNNAFLDNDNGNFQVYNTTANAINAYNNYWYYTDGPNIDLHVYDDDENGSYGAINFDPWLMTNPNLNDPPVVVNPIADQTIPEDSENNILVAGLNTVFSDVDDDSLIFSAAGPEELTLSISGDTLSATPEADYFGEVEVIVTASDYNYASVSDTFILTVENINDAPVPGALISPAKGDTVTSIDDISFKWHPAFDVDGDTLFYTLQIFGDAFDSTLVSSGDTTANFYGTGLLDFASEYKWIVLVSDGDFTVTGADTFSFITPPLLTIDDILTEIPIAYALHQNYPNPFNPVTTIRYDMVRSGDVRIIVYNLLGQKVVTLVDENRPAGFHSVKFDATRYSSGIYFYMIETDVFRKIRRMVLVK